MSDTRLIDNRNFRGDHANQKMEKMEVDNKTDGETEYDVVEEGVEVPSEEMEGDGFDISEKTLRHTV